MTTSETTGSDAKLVSRSVGGDTQAFAEIYDRYADSIYSFCRSRLRNDADAADATQDTFVRAVTRLSQLQDPDKLRSWLYAIARNEIVATGRTSSRFTGDEGMVHMASTDPELDVDLLRVESAAQLWAAAGGLQDRDHEVLELHLRHGLVGQNLADALGVSESHANVMLSRMRDRIATSLGSLLVAQNGREECAELDAVLEGWDGRFTLAVRSRVTRHTKNCEICERTRGAALASSLSFGVLPIVAAPALLRDLTVDAMATAFTAAAGTSPSASDLRHDSAEPMGAQLSEDWSWQEDGFPGGAVTEAGRRGLWLVSAAAVTVAVALGATLYALSGGGSDVVVEAVGAAVAPSVLPTPIEGPSSSGIPVATANSSDTSGSVSSTAQGASPGSTDADTTVASPGSTAATPQATTMAAPPDTKAGLTVAADPATTSQPATGEPGTTSSSSSTSTSTSSTTTSSTTTSSTTTSSTTTSSTTTSSTTATTVASQNVPPIVVVIFARPDSVEAAQGRCTGETSLVFAEASDGDGDVVSVVARWSPDGIKFLESSMVDDTGVYAGVVGPWTVAGAQVIEVVATDNEGAVAASSIKLTVTACPIDRLTLTP